MAIPKFMDYLEDSDVPYDVLRHRTDYTAQEAAADTHTPGREFAKTVLLDMGPRGYAMAVTPACYRLDLEKVRRSIGTGYVRLADENAMVMLCPDCEVGAMPPFGNLYELPVFVDPMIAADEFITFNAGSHEQAIRMRFADYERLVHPVLVDMVDPVLV